MSARAILCCLVLGLTACFRVDIEDGKLKCSTGGACPRGYTCDVDDVCRRPDELLDLAAAGGDDAGGLEGVSCTSDDQCSTGHCADGVCCTTACSGACATCNASADFRGLCIPVAAGSKPVHAGCAAQDVSTCGNTGLCGEEGACQVYAASTLCATGTCMNIDPVTGEGTTSPDSNCDGKGACVAGTGSGPCTDGCGGDLGTCPDGLQCNPDRNECLNGAPLGSACVNGSDCTSTFCVDGVCCNESPDVCSGCMTCGPVGGPGMCSNLPANSVPSPATACVASGCSSAACNGNGGCAAAPEGTACGPDTATCANVENPAQLGQYTATYIGSVCDGTGSQQTDCQALSTCVGNTVCASATTCLSTCANSAQCNAGYFCASGHCLPLVANGMPCSSSTQCTSAVCGSNGLCADCAVDADCSPAQPVCSGGTCTPCGTQGSNGAFGTCVSGGNEACKIASVGGPPRGPNCFGNGLGSSGRAGPAGTYGCQSATQLCPNGTWCSPSNVCLVAPAFPCVVNSDCFSTSCTNGACDAPTSN